MKRIIFIIVFGISVNAIFSQTYNVKIKQGTTTFYSQTSEVDEVTFEDTANFTCGNPVLYAGEAYPTVLIGSQCWFARNLNIGTRIDGSSNQTDNSTLEKYCYNDIDGNCIAFGGLYQWDEAMQYSTTEGAQGICPEGWHIPTVTEYQTLETEVDDNQNKLLVPYKENFTSNYNTSGFSALLTGNFASTFYGASLQTLIWSTTESSNTSYSRAMGLVNGASFIIIGSYLKEYGFSVRCLKD